MTSLSLAAAIAAMIVTPIPAQTTGTPTSTNVVVSRGASGILTHQPGSVESEGRSG